MLRCIQQEEYHPVSSQVYPILRSRRLPLINTRHRALIDLILEGDFGNGAVVNDGHVIQLTLTIPPSAHVHYKRAVFIRLNHFVTERSV